MPDLVIDASVAIKWINSEEPAAEQAAAMLTDYRRGMISFLAPTFWQFEIANSINKAVERGLLTETEGHDALALLLALDMSFDPFPPPQAAYALARRFQRSIYDSLYLGLAEHRGCEFWTADLRLYNATRTRCAFIRWIEDYTGIS